MARHQAGGVLDEGPVPRPAPVLPGTEGEVDAHVHAAVAEVPVRHPLQPVLVQQRLEVAEVGAQLLDRDGGVLPARVRRAGRRDVRAASPAPSSRIRHSAAASATSVTTRESRAPASARTPWAFAVTSATLSPVSSTISQPSPRGRSGTTAAGTSRSRWTIRASMPSTAVGECGSRAGVASAASAIVG